MQQKCQNCGATVLLTFPANVTYENKDGIYKMDICQMCVKGDIQIAAYKES